jgi:hypothetical protein
MIKVDEPTNYNAIVYLGMITASIIILFSMVFIVENQTKINIYELNEKITGNIISDQELYNDTFYNESNFSQENYYSEYKKPEIYQLKSEFIFYLIVIGVVSLIIIIALSLHSTIIENIKKEYEERQIR